MSWLEALRVRPVGAGERDAVAAEDRGPARAGRPSGRARGGGAGTGRAARRGGGHGRRLPAGNSAGCSPPRRGLRHSGWTPTRTSSPTETSPGTGTSAYTPGQSPACWVTSSSVVPIRSRRPTRSWRSGARDVDDDVGPRVEVDVVLDSDEMDRRLLAAVAVEAFGRDEGRPERLSGLVALGVDEDARDARHGPTLLRPSRISGERPRLRHDGPMSHEPLLRDLYQAISDGVTGDGLARFFSPDAEQVEYPSAIRPTGLPPSAGRHARRVRTGRRSPLGAVV